MNSRKWLPLFVRESGAPARADYEAINEEPSLGLQRGIVDYVGWSILESHYGKLILCRERVVVIEQALDLDLHGERTDSPLDPFIRLSLPKKLSVVDYCVFHFTTDRDSMAQVESLRSAMERSRFAYTIDLDNLALVRVLPPGVEEAVRAAFGINAANTHLREAVHWATGVRPDPLKAFDALVRALEAVVIPALAPNDGKATLGKILGAIRSGQVKLDCELPRSGQAAAGVMPIPDLVRGMLELVWSGYERHAGGAREPTVAEVRALLGVAGSLVSWFGTGLVKKS
ncbi:MAG: hypothetical protein Q8L14_23320 [Myxococcales bacterium]|nr:hypothetical protein [Myxococcales bacterium]